MAIHEAMEQQTIPSLRLVKATLNARASILCRCQSYYWWGRYDRSKSLQAEHRYVRPIMSRFDLFSSSWTHCNEVTDYAIAEGSSICTPSWRSRSRGLKERLPGILGFARMFKPKVSMESQELLVQQYKHLRQRDTGGSAKEFLEDHSEAAGEHVEAERELCRLHCSEEVIAKHVRRPTGCLTRVSQG